MNALQKTIAASALALGTLVSAPALAAYSVVPNAVSDFSVTSLSSLFTSWRAAWTSTFAAESISYTYTGLENVFGIYVGQFSVAAAPALSQSFTYLGAGTVAQFNTPGPAPVPGPIAGAGLPIVLGMMGFAAWRRRRAAAA